jgi:hypothetical protein
MFSITRLVRLATPLLPSSSTSITTTGVNTWSDAGLGIFLIPAVALGVIAAVAGLAGEEGLAGVPQTHSTAHKGGTV